MQRRQALPVDCHHGHSLRPPQTCARATAATRGRTEPSAASGVPGPVFVELPLDVLYPINEVRMGMGFLDRKRARDVILAAMANATSCQET